MLKDTVLPTIWRSLFPPKSRNFRGQRTAKIVARSIHVLCVAGLFGGHVFDVETERVVPWLLATIMTGLVILLLDLFQSGAFLLQVRGLVLYAKITLLVSTMWLPHLAVPLLGSIMVLAVLSSHAPSKIRYFLVFGKGRVVAAKTPG